MPELAELRKQPAVLVAAGAVATVGGGAVAAYRACERLPVVGTWLRRGRSELAKRGEEAIARSTEPLKALVTAITDAVVSEVDIDAIVARLDLIGLANHVIDGVDLQAIIRDSTASVTEEVMADVRTQGERADDMVSGFVDRMLGRDRDPQ
jgi:hypothetical protein